MQTRWKIRFFKICFVFAFIRRESFYVQVIHSQVASPCIRVETPLYFRFSRRRSARCWNLIKLQMKNLKSERKNLRILASRELLLNNVDFPFWVIVCIFNKLQVYLPDFFSHFSTML